MGQIHILCSFYNARNFMTNGDQEVYCYCLWSLSISPLKYKNNKVRTFNTEFIVDVQSSILSFIYLFIQAFWRKCQVYASNTCYNSKWWSSIRFVITWCSYRLKSCAYNAKVIYPADILCMLSKLVFRRWCYHRSFLDGIVWNCNNS